MKDFLKKTDSFIYKWLPIFFGCHCRDDRSFHFRGRRFPICARCTGELFGIIACCAVFWKFRLGAGYSFLILIPLIFDGFLQRLTKYESTNFKRAVTGFLFGYGGVNLFFLLGVYSYDFGFEIGKFIFCR